MLLDQPTAHAEILCQLNLGLEPELRFTTLRLDMDVKTRLLT